MNKYWTSNPNVTPYICGFSNLNNNSQQFLFMPIYPGSEDFIIVSKATGKVLKANLNGGLTTDYLANLSKAECLFNLGGSSNNYYMRLDWNKNYYANVTAVNQPISPIMLTTAHSDSKSRFTFTYKSTATNYPNVELITSTGKLAPAPPVPTSYDASNIPEYNCETLDARTIVPFNFVDDLLPNEQVKQSPYYVLEKYVGWKRVADYELPAGIGYSEEATTSYGVTYSEKNQVQKTISAQLNFKGEVSFGIGIFDFGVGNNVQQTCGLTVVSTTDIGAEYSKEIKTTFTKETSLHLLLVHYVYYEKYKLYRLNRLSSPILEWKIVPYKFGEKYWKVKGYPSSFTAVEEGSSTSMINPYRKIAIKSLSKSAEIKNNESIYISNEVEIFPNPVKEEVSLKFTLNEAVVVNFDLFDLSGRLVSRVYSSQLEEGLNEISLNLSDFHSGTYIIRAFNDNSNEIFSRKIFKE